MRRPRGFCGSRRPWKPLESYPVHRLFCWVEEAQLLLHNPRSDYPRNWYAVMSGPYRHHSVFEILDSTRNISILIPEAKARSTEPLAIWLQHADNWKSSFVYQAIGKDPRVHWRKSIFSRKSKIDVFHWGIFSALFPMEEKKTRR